jgi:hypothetical protein
MGSKRIAPSLAACMLVGCIGQSAAYKAAECISGDENKQCPQGKQCLDADHKCHFVCVESSDCYAYHQICNADRVCVDPGQPGPTITAIDGDGALNASSSQGDHVVHAGLVVTGTGLTGVTVSLAGQMAGLPSYSALSIRAGATAERLEVDLPGDVLPGSYTLGVVNQYGGASATAQLLKGDPGSCDASECVSQTFPGASRVSTIVARAVNGSTVADVSVTLDGQELIATPVDGVWLGVLDRATHALSTD